MADPKAFNSVSTVYVSIDATTTYAAVDLYQAGPNGAESLVGQEHWSLDPAQITSILATQKPVTSTTQPATRPVSSQLVLASTTATTNTSTPALSTAGLSPVKHSQGLNNGAVAGVAIGTALVGAIIGLIIGTILAKRSQKSRTLPGYAKYSDREKESMVPIVATESATTTTEAGPTDPFRLVAPPSSSVAKDLFKLRNLIQKHVQMHYHQEPVNVEAEALFLPLRDLGIERGNTLANLTRIVTLALEPTTRKKALSYVISKTIFESLAIGGSTSMSLLPPAITGFMANAQSNWEGGNTEVRELAMARWRQLATFLLHPNPSQRTPLAPSEDVSTREAEKLAQLLSGFLRPFVSMEREERYEQENDLREIIADAAVYGYLLLSHPAEYRFTYDGAGKNSLVVSPGLYKLFDEEGRPLRQPAPHVVAPVIEAV